METIGGGTVRYVGVELLPCPEDPARIGQCQGPATIEMLWNGRVVETLELRAWDELLVADGAVVEAGTALIVFRWWQHSVRAPLPEGVEAVVAWGAAIDESVDDVTGLPRRTFADRTDSVTCELRASDGAVLATLLVPGAALPRVVDGEVVRRGDALAVVPESARRRDAARCIDRVRALLDARPLERGPGALVAPCDGTVIAIGPRWIGLRTTAGRELRLRRPPTHQFVIVGAGERVRAGEPLTEGERHHRALLHAWGAERFAQHLLDELELIGGQVPRVYWALAVRAMLADGRLRGIAELARERRRGA